MQTHCGILYNLSIPFSFPDTFTYSCQYAYRHALIYARIIGVRDNQHACSSIEHNQITNSNECLFAYGYEYVHRFSRREREKDSNYAHANCDVM